LRQERIRLDALLFGESPSRVVISVKLEHLPEVQQYIQDFEGNVPMSVLGQVTDSAFINLTVQEPTKNAMSQMSWPLADLADPWQNSLSHLLASEQP
jgi:phosphoribosylformylglycinamidine (FGAM) synthase-like enzyme